MTSRYGRWVEVDGLPAFAYDADHRNDPAAEWDTLQFGRSRRHWLGVGNTRLQIVCDNEGTVCVFDEAFGFNWLVAPDPAGSGISRVQSADGAWSTAFGERPSGPPPVRTFGPTWFAVAVVTDDVALTRTVLCPEGDVPWLLVRVRFLASRPVSLTHVEEWEVRPRFVNFVASGDGNPQEREQANENARRLAVFDVRTAGARVTASERPRPVTDTLAVGGVELALAAGPPRTIVLEALGDTPGRPHGGGAPHPMLTVETDLNLEAGVPRDLWFRFGLLEDGDRRSDPEEMYEASLRQLRKRLPRASSARAQAAAAEVPWHAAVLTGGVNADGVLGGRTLAEGAFYSFALGFNGIARDSFQLAVPLVYLAPELALSVLRNTLAWGAPDGSIAYIVDGAKRPRPRAALGLLNENARPSDLSLWPLWLAAELATVTGDLAPFGEAAPFHPIHDAAPVTLYERLRRCYAFLFDAVGTGPNGLIRILDCDWSDSNLGELERFGLDKRAVSRRGESVMNSALASWILPVFASLADKLGDGPLADDARARAGDLRSAVARTWNGRWFARAVVDDVALGDDVLFLDCQPWALLGGAADEEQARALLRTIDERLRRDSPLGARRRSPLPESPRRGQSLRGGTWYALQAALVWAARRFDQEYAWDEWRRMTLANHMAAYPDIWEGTLSGPDSYNAPEAERPGRTWGLPGDAYGSQAFPVNNMHSHAQPLLAYLRLLGVEPLADGSLSVATDGGCFASEILEVDERGSGILHARGPVALTTRNGIVRGGPGHVQW